MRKILQGSIALLALMTAVPTIAVAQQVEPQLDVTSATAPARHKAPAKEMVLTDNQMWYGYYKGTEPIVGMGVPAPGIINEMIYINAADPIITGKTEATVTLQADADYARADKQLVITRVNGQPNEQMAEAVADGSLITLAQASPRRTLIEEYTGTWCGYCPRGTIGLELLREEFADDIAVVSIHTDDPMTILGYQPMYENVRDYPTAFFNREYDVDPYAGSLEQPRGSRYDVLWQQSLPTEASLDVKAQWSSSLQTRINVTSTMRFQYQSDTAPYGLAYVLVEDGLECDTTGWEQRNFYYYFKDQDDYKPGTQMGDDFKDYLNVDTEYMQGVVYNDVAVAAYGITEGLANSVKAPLAVGEEKTHSYTISVGLNNLIQDKQRLRVVAFIIDRKSGRVVNAAVADVHSETDGIESVPADVAAHEGTARTYDLQERPVVGRQPAGALRIVRQPDGRVVKTLARP